MMPASLRNFLWKVLEDLPAEHNGQVHLPRPSSPSSLSLVYVTHAHGDDGPHLRAFGSGGEYPLDLEQLRKKLTTLSIQTNRVFQCSAGSSAARLLIEAGRGRRGYRLRDASCDEIEFLLLWALRQLHGLRGRRRGCG
jgi:hypothetical protein